MSNSSLQKIVLLMVTEVGKIILKKKRPLLLARSVYGCYDCPEYCFSPFHGSGAVTLAMLFIITDTNIMPTKWSINTASTGDYLRLYQQHANKESYTLSPTEIR